MGQAFIVANAIQVELRCDASAGNGDADAHRRPVRWIGDIPAIGWLHVIDLY
jgi:hypothetical protein